MKRKLIKYGLLVFFGLLALGPAIRLGDYSAGMASAMATMMFGAVFVFLFLLILIEELYKVIKHRQKFDLIPVGIFLFFAAFALIIINADSNKFRAKKILKAETDAANYKLGRLTLYSDNTFAATVPHADFSNTYQGEYSIKSDTVFLKRTELPKLTDSLFYNCYIIDTITKTLAPVNKYFSKLIIQK